MKIKEFCFYWKRIWGFNKTNKEITNFKLVDQINGFNYSQGKTKIIKSMLTSNYFTTKI